MRFIRSRVLLLISLFFLIAACSINHQIQSPDKKHKASIISNDHGNVDVFVDGVLISSEFKSIKRIFFGFGTNNHVFYGLRKGKYVQVINGVESNIAYEDVSFCKYGFTRNGTKPIFFGFRENKWYLNVDGVEQPISYDNFPLDEVYTNQLGDVCFFGAMNGKIVFIKNGIEISKQYDTFSKGGVFFNPIYHTPCFVGVRNEKWYMVINGQEVSIPYDAVSEQDIKFSPLGTKTCFMGKREDKWYLVVNGVEISGPYKTFMGDSFSFNPTNEEVCVLGVNDRDKWVILVNGVEKSEYYEAVSEFGLQYSPLGSKTCFMGKREDKWFLIINGEEVLGPFLYFMRYPIRFSMDDSKYLLFAKSLDNSATVLIMSGQILNTEYSDLELFLNTFSPNNKHCFFAGKKNGFWRVVCDGVDGPLCEDIYLYHFGNFPGTIKFIPNTDDYIYFIKSNNKQELVYNNSLSGVRFDKLINSEVYFSSYGGSWGIVTEMEGNSCVVINGNIGPKIDEVLNVGVIFSFRGMHSLYFSEKNELIRPILDKVALPMTYDSISVKKENILKPINKDVWTLTEAAKFRHSHNSDLIAIVFGSEGKLLSIEATPIVTPDWDYELATYHYFTYLNDIIGLLGDYYSYNKNALPESLSGIAQSCNGENLLFFGKRDDIWYANLNGVEQHGHDEVISNSVIFSDDGEHYSYIAYDSNTWKIYCDNIDIFSSGTLSSGELRFFEGDTLQYRTSKTSEWISVSRN